MLAKSKHTAAYTARKTFMFDINVCLNIHRERVCLVCHERTFSHLHMNFFDIVTGHALYHFCSTCQAKRIAIEIEQFQRAAGLHARCKHCAGL